MKFNKVLIATAALGMSASASALNVGGVHWDPSSPFDFTSNSQLIEDQLDLPNGIDTLNGFGKVTGINNTFEATFCPSGCELTYVFGGFTVDTVLNPGDPGNPTSDDTYISFTGGWINFYVDSTTSYDADDMSTASDGSLWLSMAGHAISDPRFGGDLITISAELTSFGSGTDAGSGEGLLDVTGGLAAANFDTDTQTDGADWVFSSSFQPIPAGPTSDGFELFGSADFRGISVPEPSTIALLGLGLLSIGFRARKLV